MKIPIAFALNGGQRKEIPFGRIDLASRGKLTFYEPDTARFPALRLAYEALAAGDSALITLNVANEMAVLRLSRRKDRLYRYSAPC